MMDENFNRSRQAKKVTLIGSLVNIVLTAVKIVAGIVGKSGAMIADGVHSLSDLLTDVVVMVGFRITEKPEDENHNYGHGKFETLAALVISIFLFHVGLEIFKSGCLQIWKTLQGNPPPQPGKIALAAAVLSILSKEGLYQYTVRAGKKLNSASITANAWHHRSDALSSLGSFIGIGGAILLGDQWTVLDPLACVLVSLMIFKVAYDILRPSVSELMEVSLDKDEKEEIQRLIESCTGVLYYHELRSRRLGNRVVIEVFIHVQPDLRIDKAHDIATKVEEKLRMRFGRDTIITVHIEPHREENDLISS